MNNEMMDREVASLFDRNRSKSLLLQNHLKGRGVAWSYFIGLKETYKILEGKLIVKWMDIKIMFGAIFLIEKFWLFPPLAKEETSFSWLNSLKPQ